MRKNNVKFRQKLSVILIAVFLLTDFSVIGSDYAVKATAKREKAAATESLLRKKLAKTVDKYPDGAFDLSETQVRVTEGREEKRIISILREGSTDKKAVVTLKAVDVTASYGEDYRLIVDGEALTKPEDAVSMIDLFGDTVTAKYGNGTDDGDDAMDAQVVSGGAAGADEASEKHVSKAKERLPEVKEVKKDGLSPLQRGSKVQTGRVETQKDWREITKNDPDYSEAEATMEKGASDIQKIISTVVGTSHTFVFEKGEYKKDIEIEIIDDDISEGEEQVALMLTDPEVSVLGASYHGYLNLQDDEKETEARYELKDRIYTAEAGASQVKITAVKKSAFSRMTVTDITAADDTAKSGENYVFETQPIVFLPGEREKEITIPVSNLSTTEDLCFTVGINSGNGKAEGNKALALVNLKKSEPVKEVSTDKDKPSKKKKSGSKKSKDTLSIKGWRKDFIGGAGRTVEDNDKIVGKTHRVFRYEGYKVPDSSVCTDKLIEYVNSDEHKNSLDKYNRWVDIPLDSMNGGIDIDLTFADRIEIDYSSKWNEGQRYYKWKVLKKKPYNIKDREIAFCINGDESQYCYKKESEDKIGKQTCTIKLNAKRQGKGRLKYRVRGINRNKVDGASLEIYSVRIYYKKIRVVVWNESIDRSNYHDEIIYSGDSDTYEAIGTRFKQLGKAELFGDERDVAYKKDFTSGEGVMMYDELSLFHYDISYPNTQKNSIGVSPTENNIDFLGFAVMDKDNNPINKITRDARNKITLRDKLTRMVNIKPSKDTFYDSSDIVAYVDHAHNFWDRENCIVLVPIFIPKEVKYIFQSSDGAVYNNYVMNKSVEKAFKATMLDTIKVHAAPKEAGKTMGGYTAVDDKGNTYDVIFDNEHQEGTVDVSTGMEDWGKRSDTPVVTVDTSLDGISLTVKPWPLPTARSGSSVADARNLDKMGVMYIDPEGKESGITNLDNGYSFKIGESLANGSECTLVGVENNTVKNASGENATEINPDDIILDPDRYTIIWVDGTCDTNNDGEFSAAEMKKMYGTTDQQNIPALRIHVGDAWKYLVDKSYTKIYYQVRKTNPQEGLRLFGSVCVKDKAIFHRAGDEEEIVEYVDGATVAMGHDTSTTYNNGTEGSGYYEMDADGNLEREGYYNVSVNYSPGDGSTMHGHVYTNPGKYTLVSLLTDSIMDVPDASVQQLKEDSEFVNSTWDDAKWIGINYYDMSNADTFYKLNFNVISKDVNRVPVKAYLRFYKKDGSLISLGKKETKDLEGNTVTLPERADSMSADIGIDGKVSFIFNPKLFDLPPGTILRLQIEDQMKTSGGEGGTLYPERYTGISLQKQLDQLMVLSSFALGADNFVVDILGKISSKFDMASKVDLNIKTESGFESKVETGDRPMSDIEKKYYDMINNKGETVINESFDINNNPKIGYVTVSVGWSDPKLVNKELFKTAAQKKSEADQKLSEARMKNRIVKLQRDAGLKPVDMDGDKIKEVPEDKLKELEKEYNEASKALDNEVAGKILGIKEKKKLSSNLKIALSFSFVLNFHRDPLLEGNPLYFDSFILMVEGDGDYKLESKFMLPIGITINIGFSVGGTLGATFIVESPLDESHNRYYLEKVEPNKPSSSETPATSGSAVSTEEPGQDKPTSTETPAATEPAVSTEEPGQDKPVSTETPATTEPANTPEVSENSEAKTKEVSKRDEKPENNILSMDVVDDVKYLNPIKMVKESGNFNSSGVFSVNPRVTLSAGAGWGDGLLSVGAEVGGTADFDMNFFAGYKASPDDKDYGVVTLIASITAKISLYEHTWKWKTKPLPLFGEAPLSAKGFDSRAYIAEDASVMKTTDFGYLKGRSGWQGDDGEPVDNNTLSIKASGKNAPGVVMKTLQEQVYSGTRVDIKSIGGGNYMAVFLDADPTIKLDLNRIAAYYTIYTASKGKWSRPVKLDNDKTGDEDVKLVDLGERGMIALWVDSSEEFTSKTLKTMVLSKKNLSGRFFDKTTKSFGRVMEITKDTSPDPEAEDYGYDLSADLKPNIVYSDAKKSMICYYTKCEYDYTETAGEKIGDITYPTFSKMAYREYRFSGDTGTDGKWIEDYTELTDKNIQQDIINDGKELARYQKIWYGQVTFDTMADIYIDETLDNEGYWSADMLNADGKLSDSRIYKGHRVTGGASRKGDSKSSTGVVTEDTEVSGSTVMAESEPRIVDTDAISYKNSAGDDYGLFAFTVDYDQDLGTSNDRDIYLQYFDFNNGYMTHPIIITSDDICDQNVKFVQNDTGTHLAWLHDGDLVLFALDNLESHLIKKNDGKITYYILDKTAPQINETMTEEEKQAAYDKAYTPYQVIADGHRHIKEKVLYPGDVGYPEDKKDGKPYYPDGKDESEGVITDFDVSATGATTYFTWTETVTKLKKGVDENSVEATLPKNNLVESQLWMTKIYSGDETTEGEITEPVQVTDYKGTNFGRVASEVTETGALKLVAIKAGTEVVKDKKKASYAAVSAKKDLISVDVVPYTKPEILTDEGILDDMKAGQMGGFTFDIHNNGLARSGDLKVRAVTDDGSSVLTQASDTEGVSEMQTVDEISIDSMLGGSSVEIPCRVTPDRKSKSVSVTITILDSNGKKIAKKTVKRVLTEAVSPVNSEVALTENRDRFDIGFDTVNNGGRRSKKRKATIGIIKNKKKIKLKTVSIDAIDAGDSKHYECTVDVNSGKYFSSKVKKNGDVRETGTFFVKIDGKTSKTMIIREANAAQIKPVSKLAKKLAGGKKARIKVGQKYYNIGLRSKNKKLKKKREIPGIKVIYKSTNPAVAGVSRSGVITGLKKGKAKIKVIVMPDDIEDVVATSDLNISGTSGYFADKVDRYVLWPNKAIRVYSITVKVTKKKHKNKK